MASAVGQGLGAVAKKVATPAINYFTPTSNAGNNFWSTPVAKSLANVQSNIQKTTQPVVQKVQQVAQNVGSFLKNLNPFRRK